MSEDEKSYWKDRTLWHKKVTVEITEACLQSDYDEPEYKLAHMILKEVIFCNNGHWRKDWPKDHVTLHVNCNDVFGWACADAEDITYKEIDELYEMWKKDPNWGPAVWCVKKRKVMPQYPVAKMISEAGIWNLEELIKEAKNGL